MNTYSPDDDFLQDDVVFAGGEDDDDITTPSEITPELLRVSTRTAEETNAIVDSLTDPDEPEDLATSKMPHSDEMQGHILGAMLTDAGFLSESVRFVRGSQFADNSYTFLADVAKQWAEKYGTTATPPRFFFEEQTRERKADARYVEVFDRVVASFRPAYLPVCRDVLMKWVQQQECRIAIDKHIDNINKGKEDLAEHIAALQKALSIGTAADPDCFLDLVELLDSQQGYNWFIDQYLYAGSLTVFAGDPGAGKTVFLQQLLADLLFGALVLDDRTTQPVKVCWLDYDSNGEHFKDNLRVAVKGRDPKTVRQLFHYASTAGEGGKKPLPGVLTTELLDGIKKKHNPGIIVIDPLRGAFGGKDKLPPNWESDSGTMTALLDPLRTWAHANGVAIILIHHHNKTGGISGSFAIQSCADVIWDFERKPDDTRAKLVARKRLPHPSGNKLFDYTDRIYSYAGDNARQAENVSTINLKIGIAEKVWAALPKTKTEIETEVFNNKDRTTVRTVFDELDRCGAIALKKRRYEKLSDDKFNNWVFAMQTARDAEGGNSVTTSAES